MAYDCISTQYLIQCTYCVAMPEESRDCKICGEPFKNEMFRVIHVRAEHPEVLKYTCKCCNRGYETWEAIQRHEKVCVYCVFPKFRRSLVVYRVIYL